MRAALPVVALRVSRIPELEANTAPGTGRVSPYGDLGAPLVAAFPHGIAQGRVQTLFRRDARLAAIHSLFRSAALRHREPRPRCDASWLSR
jgi:hypothetical protein